MAVQHIIHDNSFWLSHQRCLFWEEQKALIVSDLHIGKTGHFRKSGIAVPQNIFKEDLQRLFSEIQYYQPMQLIIVGDLFHSTENKEMELFLKWRVDLDYLQVHLIKGNHDVLKDKWYMDASITLHNTSFCINQFLFTHDASTYGCEDDLPRYIFSGHVHPGVVIKGMGRQSLRFPCYFFGENYAVLPAFSKFTGLAVIAQGKTDTVYAIVDKSVLQL